MKNRILLLLGCMLHIQLMAQTYVSGQIGGVWTESASPYIVTTDIILPPDSSLVIHEGVEVLFNEGMRMIVHGSFKAQGTSDDSVTFTSRYPDTRWEGMTISFVPEEKDSILLEYCRFTKATGQDTAAYNRAYGAMYLEEVPKIRISNCLFRDNTGYIASGIASFGSPLIIEGCVFELLGGRAIMLYHSNAFISHTLLKNNEHFGWDGGAIRSVLSSPKIISNEIVDNEGSHGVGIFLQATTDAIIENNLISGNYGDGHVGGVGIFAVTASGIINHNTIINNTSPTINMVGYTRGGGISVGDCNLIISNNLISGNVAAEGAGISINSPHIVLMNNTIVNNGANGTTVGGIFINNSSNLRSYNDLVYYNYPDTNQIFSKTTNHNMIFYNSCLPENLNTSRYTVVNPLTEEPNFMDIAGGDFSLKNTSPCINRGYPDTSGLNLPAVDLNDNPRIHNRIVDIGAYENQSVNTGPVTLNDSLHFQLQEDFGEFKLYMNTVFDDDATVKYLSYELIDPHTSNCFDVYFSEGYLYLYSKAELSGFDTLHILAKDDFNLVTDAILFFETTVVDDPPVLIHPVPDFRFKVNAADTLIDLKDVFTDVDSPDSLITFNLDHRRPDLLTAVLQQKKILLQISPENTGTDTLFIQAVSNFLFALDTFMVEVYDPSSIDEMQKHAISIYPNPASDHVDVSFEKGVDQIRLYNLDGELLQIFSPAKSEEQLRINLQDYQKGVYLLRFFYSQQSVALKFVKN